MVLDTRSVHVAAGVPAATTGLDPAKRVPGRKRGLAVDVLGLVIAVVVLAANTHDNAVGIALLDQIAEHAGETVEKALVDQGFKKQVVVHCTVGIDVEIVERNPQDKGFVPSRSPGRPSPRSLTGSLPRPPRPTGPSTRTTPASSPSSTRPPAPSEPVKSAKPSATNNCRRTSKAPAPS
ncbi:hypothetical protein EES39_24335 [Streptomyces sp. ADI92-24]|nr:hypothetical protein EES39_24335 [Streptomyces sp. ADI92-24]